MYQRVDCLAGTLILNGLIAHYNNRPIAILVCVSNKEYFMIYEKEQHMVEEQRTLHFVGWGFFCFVYLFVCLFFFVFLFCFGGCCRITSDLIKRYNNPYSLESVRSKATVIGELSKTTQVFRMCFNLNISYIKSILIYKFANETLGQTGVIEDIKWVPVCYSSFQ